MAVQQTRKNVQSGGGEKDEDVQSEVSDLLSQKGSKTRKKGGGTIKSILRHATKTKKRIPDEGGSGTSRTTEGNSRSLKRRNSKVRWELDGIDENEEALLSETPTKAENLVVCVQDDNAENDNTNGKEDGNVFVERVSEYLDNLLNGDEMQSGLANQVNEGRLEQPLPLMPTSSALNRDSMKLADELVLKMLGDEPTDERKKKMSNAQRGPDETGSSRSIPINHASSAAQEFDDVDKYRSIDHDEELSVQTQRSVVLKAAQRVSHYTNELLSILSNAPAQGENRAPRSNDDQENSGSIQNKNADRGEGRKGTEKRLLPLNTISGDKYRPVEGEVSTPSPKKTIARPSTVLVDEEIDATSGSLYIDDLSPLSTKSARSSMLAKNRLKQLMGGKKSKKAGVKSETSYTLRQKSDMSDEGGSYVSQEWESNRRNYGDDDDFESRIEICNDELVKDGTDKYSQNSTFEYEKKSHLPVEKNSLSGTSNLKIGQSSQRNDNVGNNFNRDTTISSNELNAAKSRHVDTTEEKKVSANVAATSAQRNDDSPFITKNQFLELISMLRGDINIPEDPENKNAKENSDEKANEGMNESVSTRRSNDASNGNDKSENRIIAGGTIAIDEERHQNSSARDKEDYRGTEAYQDHKREISRRGWNKSDRRDDQAPYRPKRGGQVIGPIDLTVSSSATTDSDSVIPFSSQQRHSTVAANLKAIPASGIYSSSDESSAYALDSVQLVNAPSYRIKNDQSRRFTLNRTLSKGSKYGESGKLRMSKGKTPMGEILTHARLPHAMSAISLDDSL